MIEFSRSTKPFCLSVHAVNTLLASTAAGQVAVQTQPTETAAGLGALAEGEEEEEQQL